MNKLITYTLASCLLASLTYTGLAVRGEMARAERILFLENEVTKSNLAEDIYRLTIKRASETYPWAAKFIAVVMGSDPDIIMMRDRLDELEREE